MAFGRILVLASLLWSLLVPYGCHQRQPLESSNPSLLLDTVDVSSLPEEQRAKFSENKAAAEKYFNENKKTLRFFDNKLNPVDKVTVDENFDINDFVIAVLNDAKDTNDGRDANDPKKNILYGFRILTNQGPADQSTFTYVLLNSQLNGPLEIKSFKPTGDVNIDTPNFKAIMSQLLMKLPSPPIQAPKAEVSRWKSGLVFGFSSLIAAIAIREFVLAAKNGEFSSSTILGGPQAKRAIGILAVAASGFVLGGILRSHETEEAAAASRQN